MGFPGGLVVKNPPAKAVDPGDVGLILGSGRSPVEGNGNPLQYSCLGNSMHRGAWQDTVPGVTESDTTEHASFVLFIILSPWDFPSKNTGVGCHFLLQGIFPTQISNPGLPHCRQTLYLLSHQESPDCKVLKIQ